jgi:hypothetical protein
VKEDDAEHETRRASAEKHKTARDVEKKEKRKNLERQALEECRGQVRREGRPEEDSPDEDNDDDFDDDDDSEGMAACLDRILQAPPHADVSLSRMVAPKGSQGGEHEGRRRETSPRCPRADTPPATTRGRADLLPRPPQASGPGYQVKTSRTGPRCRGGPEPGRRASKKREP